MRLLVATYARAVIGGVETYLRGIIPELIARGDSVALLCEHRFEVRAKPGDPYAECAAEWSVADLGLDAVIHAARAWRPDAIWIHGLASHPLEAALLDLAPALLFAHNYDGTCATGNKYYRWPAAHACGRVLGPACWAVNLVRDCGLPNPAGFAAGYRRQRQRSDLFPRYRAIMVASGAMAAEFRRHGVAGERIRLLPYPLLSPRVERLSARCGVPRALIMLSRLTAAKGGDFLLRAIALAEPRLQRRLQLTIAGDGPERLRLRDLAQRLRLRVEFAGWIGPLQRLQRLRIADLLVIPSVWPEPFGMVGIEAAAQGVPAVGYQIGGIPDWLRPGRTGELAAPITPAALADALIRALGDESHYESLRQAAWQSTLDFQLPAHLDRLRQLLAAACAG